MIKPKQAMQEGYRREAEWYTPVTIEPFPPEARGVYGAYYLSVGSCFSSEVAEQFRRLGYRMLVNPYGTLYNPLSIAQALEFLAQPECPHSAGELFLHNGLYHSPYHHGEYSAPDREAAAHKIQAAWAQGHKHLTEGRQVWITFGTTRTYRFTEQAPGAAVANCHKLPPDRFIEENQSWSYCLERMQAAVRSVRRVNPHLSVLCTVSPIRYLKEGLQENCLNKSKLRLLCQALCEEEPQVYYFPAYEIMMDELRDYRFWAADMLHPTPQAREYIGRRLAEVWSAPEEEQAQNAARKLRKLFEHRPLHDSGRAALQQQIQKAALHLSQNHPQVCIPNILTP